MLESAGNMNRRHEATFGLRPQLSWPHLLHPQPFYRTAPLKSLKKKKWLFTDHATKRPLKEPTLQTLHRRPTHHSIHGEKVFRISTKTGEQTRRTHETWCDPYTPDPFCVYCKICHFYLILPFFNTAHRHNPNRHWPGRPVNVHKGRLYSTCETEESPQPAGATNEPGKIPVFSDISTRITRLLPIFHEEHSH